MFASSTQHLRRLLRGFIVLLVVLSASFSFAQPLVPINIGDSVTGSLTQSEPSLRYAFQLEEPTQIEIRVFAVSGGLLPSLRLIGPTGTTLATAPNPTGDDQLQVEASVGRGIHQIIVTGVNGTLGQFLLLVETGAPAVPPQALPEGQVVTAAVDSANTLRTYSFRGGVEDMLLFVDSDLALSGPTVTLKEAASGETLGLSNARLVGVRFTIPGGQVDYLLEVASSGGGTEPYKVCLVRESAAGVCGGLSPAVVTIATRTPQPIVISTQIPPTAFPTVQPTATLAPLPPSAVCIAGSLTGNLVNVRSGPSTSTPVVTTLSGLNVANVIGRLPDTSWYQVSANGQTGWMSATVVRLGGPCQTIPVVSPTAVPSPVTPTLPPAVTVVPTLNPGGSPTYGTASLTSGFAPDPYQVIVTSGGPIDVSYLPGCVGFAAQNPDYQVTYTAGVSTMLRFYFIGSADTTMVVRAPGGNFTCIDDSFGTSNPTIDISFPATGTYSVWVANYVNGVGATGTLAITEIAGNHP